MGSGPEKIKGSTSASSGKNVLRALVVDDSKFHRVLQTALLRFFKVETTAAENGKEAVDLFRSGSNFDIVLMDKEMPVMDGPEVFLQPCNLYSLHQGIT